MPKKSILVTNMDGVEWKRSKFSSKVQRFLKYAEKLAVKYSDYFISDSIGRTPGATKEYLNQCRKKISPWVEKCLEIGTR